MARDFGLSKESAQLLRSRLQAKYLLAPDIHFAWYRKPEEEFITFVSQSEPLVYCKNIPDIIKKLGAQYDPAAWRPFNDS